MIEAVTLDAFGTLLELRDPVPALREALHARGVERAPAEVEAAFRAEADYYVPRSYEGRDEESLARLRRECAAVFLRAAGTDIDPEEFVGSFMAALAFRAVPGAADAIRELRRRGLALAVVSNWDMSLPQRLREAGLDGFDAVVSSAEAGAQKPDPRPFALALARLGVAPARALHVGDGEADEEGARAAGMRFAHAPLADVVRRLA